MYSRCFDLVPSKQYLHRELRNIILVVQDLRMLSSKHRVSRRPIATIVRQDIFGTNFSDWVEEGEATSSVAYAELFYVN
jgi:hypothetical protein